MAAREFQTSLSCYTFPHGARTKRRFQGRLLDSVCSANSRCRVHLLSEVNRAVRLLHPLPHPCLILGSSASRAALGFPSCLGHGFGFFEDADSHVAPPSYPGTAVGASDETVICRMVWDDESIAATLTAPERGSVRVRLNRLRHDTASILVGRTTTGEECGASLFSKRHLSRRIAKARAHRREGTNQC